MTDFEDDEPTSETNFDRLLRESSLGSPAARLLRRRVSDGQVQRVRRLLTTDAGRQSPVSITPVDNPAALPAAPALTPPAVDVDQPRVELQDARRNARSADYNETVQTGSDQLSERERRVLRLLATGRPVADIAADLLVEPSTVRFLVRRLCTKCGLAQSSFEGLSR